MTSRDFYDAVVIGGGLAGAAAAIALARAGKNVAVFEKESGPHDKVCGEFLSFECLSYLESFGIDVDSYSAATLMQCELFSAKHHLTLPFAENARALSRAILDEACLQKAVKEGAHVFRGHSVTEVKEIPTASVFEIHAAQKIVRAKNIFLATGKHELKSLQTRTGRENSAIGFKMYWRLNTHAAKNLQHKIALFFFPGGYAGLCSIEDGRTNLGFILNKENYKNWGGSFETSLAQMKKFNPAFAEILINAEPLLDKPLAVAGLPYGHLHRTRAKKRIYILGDQFSVIPSLSGTGMAIALITAHRAVLHFLKNTEDGALTYNKDCAALIRKRMLWAYPVHALSRSAFLSDALVLIMRCFPTLPRALLRRTRLPIFEAASLPQ